MKSVRIRSYSGRHFPAFGLNGELQAISPYSVGMRENADQNTPNKSTFYSVIIKVNWSKKPNPLKLVGNKRSYILKQTEGKSCWFV